MFIEPLSKCSSCLTYILLITFQHITFVSINYTTLFCYVVLIFWCHQFIIYGLPTLEMNLNAISLANIFQALTQAFIIWCSYVTSADVIAVFFLLVLGVLVFSFILLIAQSGYLHIDGALCKFVCSSSNRCWLEQMCFALCSSELMMLYLLDMAWWLFHCRY